MASRSGDVGPDGQHDELLSIVRAFQRGDRGSFDRLYERLWGPIALRASRMGLGRDECEETAQKVLVRVYLYASTASFDATAKVWAWVYAIATREVYKLWRKRRPESISPEALEAWAGKSTDPSDGPPAAAASAETIEHVQQCLSKLEPDERRALLGVLLGQLTFRQAAEEEDLRLGQFKHRYVKALDKVRRCMRVKGHDVG